MNRLEYDQSNDSEGHGKTETQDEGDYVPEQTDKMSADDDDDNEKTAETGGANISTIDDERKRGDKLWAEFLKDVEREKNKKSVETLTANKRVEAYDFAGERVKISQSGNSNSKAFIASNGSHPSSLASPPVASTDGGTLISSPSSLQLVTSESETSRLTGRRLKSQASLPRKNRVISFLSGDPAKIGLGGGKRGLAGLQAVKNALMMEKKQKMDTLEKSRYDWESFKESEGIDEELQTQVKGRTGFLERQEFLQRADFRQFEIEKNIRTERRRSP